MDDDDIAARADELRSARKVEPAQLCEWFARCDHVATRTRSHPVLGNVPICERCDDKIARLER